VLNLKDTTGILTYDLADAADTPSQSENTSMDMCTHSSNTVMAVVPDSDRIPFFIDFQTVSSDRY